ncbi:MAG TPA: protein phosphatase 2C domain-containing protein, partial [Candidatus Binatia bacterium]|nr:protein phosphatase 2C domain-containing protein [Candidatus Binatia bacterium]
LESMELAIRRANAVVFEKAAADIEKRGMGTTFSAMIIADMKAHIVHVGDSRIYLIRKNKMKKITTDHSFVEKLVEEGRISPEEARDHPQKNVLYMSLGARENLTPEVLGAMVIEEGDALVMCSDGLSNMVTDDEMMKTVMDYYPEDAANSLVRLANANGGADNITLQIVRVGSLETLEKTKPIRVARSRKKLFGAISLLLLLTALAALWTIFGNSGPSEQEKAAAASAVILKARQTGAKALPVDEIDSSELRALALTAADCRFLADRKLHFVKNDRLVVFDLRERSLRNVQMKNEDQVVPTPSGVLYLLRRSPIRAIDYRLLKEDDVKPLLIIQADKRFDLKDTASGQGRIFKIANLQTGIVPDFINESIFIFHDSRQYFAIKNWQTSDSQQFPIPDLVFSETTRLFFKKIDGRMTMLYSHGGNGRVSVFHVDSLDKLEEYKLPQLPAPLLIESGTDQALVYYYPDHYRDIRRGKAETRRPYDIRMPQFDFTKILLDMENGQKLFFTANDAIVTLSGGS